MTFALTARFPLGGYRGHVQPGVPELIPSVARLHAALLAAAAAGATAVDHDEGLAPTPDNHRLLEWMEEHPPTGIAVPDAPLPGRRPIAYRDLGLLEKQKRRSVAKAPTSPPTVPWVTWVWQDTPPPEVVHALERLCPDVSHLGTSESPVRLSIGAGPAPTHVLDADADLFIGGGLDLELPTGDRTRVLLDAHRRRVTARPPKSDAAASKEAETAEAPDRTATALARYVPVDRTGDGLLPWRTVLLLPLHRDGGIADQHKVAWAVAVHRALISSLGDAPSIITGQYAPGVPRPPNRVAIQFIDPTAPLRRRPDAEGATDILAIALPAASTATDEAAVLGFALLVPSAGFWQPPPHGRTRRWRPCPAAVPETRGPRGAGWDLGDAALHSVALAFRGIWDAVPSGDRGLRAMRAQAIEHGVAVTSAEPITGTSAARYVHRVRPGTVARPYRADLDLGDVGAEQPLLAIGQSRHLGGGLLVPHDIPGGAGA
jgi:CRISPR-associated protein Csb2